MGENPSYDELERQLNELQQAASRDKQTIQRLQAQILDQNTLMDNTLDGIVVIDQSHRVRQVNRQFAMMLGYTPQEMLHLHTWDWEVHMDETRVRSTFRDLSQAKIKIETQHRRKDGSIYDAEVTVCGAKLESEAMVLCITRDITRRKQNDKELLARKQFLQTVLKTTVEGFLVVDCNGRFTEVNDAYCTTFGYRREELLGKHVQDVAANESPEGIKARLNAVISQGSQIFEAQHIRKDGSLCPIEISATYIDVYGGRVVCFCRDLTRHKEAKAQIDYKNQLLNYIIEHAKSAVAVHDRQFRYIYVSKNYLEQYKIKEKNVIGRHHYDVFPDLPEKWKQAHKMALKGEVSRADRDPYPKADGTVVWNRWECRPWYELDGSIGGFVIYTEVITEQIRAEEALRKSRESLKAIIDASPLAIISLDDQGLVNTWNLAAEQIFGWTAREAEGRFLPIIPQKEQAQLTTFLNQVLGGASFSQVERLSRHKTAVSIPVNLTTAPIRDSKGQVTAIMMVLEDITEKKRADQEKKKLQAQLIQAQKMESVGRLAGGVAHDYNNMLSVIQGYTELSLEEISPDDPIRSNLKKILTAATRSIDITRQLLAFSRKQTIRPKVFHPNELIDGMLNMIQPLIGENIDLIWTPGSGVWQVYMDPSQLNQVLINLCVNARDAITNIGRISIETGNRIFNPSYCKADSDIGAFVLITVSDNGCGMDKETQSHLFEPFYTTKEIGTSTGLGLATVYGIVKQNHGFITVHSKPGRGTKFRLYLPRHDAPVSLTGKETGQPADFCGNERILLVEDETAILKMTQKMLERLGYEVAAANDPGQAMHLARQGQPFDLIMTDVIMPEMNGRDLVSNLHQIHPGLKALFMSGYPADVIAHQGEIDGDIHFIQKPFSKQELSAKIREVLDG